MLKTLIRLSDGREISSGVYKSINIRSCTTTQCCNSGDDLTIGSVCAACVEMVVEAPDGTFRSDDVFTLYKVDETGTRTQIGVFNIFEPRRKGKHLWQVTAYDNVIKLDTDLSDWLNENMAELSGAPDEFARAVCEQCGVHLADAFPRFYRRHYVDNFSVKGSVTGRKLLQWVAELLCCFCIADSNGDIRFDWYRNNTKVVLRDYGERYRFQGSSKLKGVILPIDGVVIFYAQSPDGDAGSICRVCRDQYSNPYLITDNPILHVKRDDQDVQDIADEILIQLEHDALICQYGNLVACEVSTPASLDINIGDIIVVDEREQQDLHPEQLYMRVMTKIQKGQKDTLQCVGPYRRRN